MSITQQIRRDFLKYFSNSGHAEIASSSVVPHDDPTLLFINAGMNQFKDVFLGRATRDYRRAVTSQKCIRVGGKHNDLENVGHTSRHLTFFEMLGNFSFGDYFKKDAIEHAWNVALNVFGFDPDRIWPTIFLDDDESYELWKQHVPAHRIVRFGEKENFWAMGDTGPCGPCSELLYDRGSKYGAAKSPLEDYSGERYLEFWNLVFMQYNRTQAGVLEPLPKPSIDTGSGLERVVSLKMNVENVFETDLMRSLIAQIENVSGRAYNPHDAASAPAFHVIADHLRCLSFAIADGAQPSNVDRGYVLRKVLRRAVRYGRMLGMEEPFLAKILPRLVSEMGADYRELGTAEGRIAEIMSIEEEAFIRTLRRGGNILSHVVSQAVASGQIISGDDAFKLKDTYGLPLDEILLLAKDSNLTVDTERFQVLEDGAKERSRAAQKNILQEASENLFTDYLEAKGESSFVGYGETRCEATILGLVKDGQFVTSLMPGDTGIVLLDVTPFYAEMGGQIGDTGMLQGSRQLFRVLNCTSPYKGVIAHVGEVVEGPLHVGDKLIAAIDDSRREKIRNNHTATHLLHWALHAILGEHVKQAGSVVDAQRMRFDFSHHKALTAAEISAIEDLVNAKIRENRPVDCYEMSYAEVQKKSDIKQFFGDKYGSIVRVVDMDFSKELCGGTHASHTGNIGFFRICKEGSIAAGVRRIEAVTGAEAEAFTRESDALLSKVAMSLKAHPHQVEEKILKLLDENKQLQAYIKSMKKAAFDQLLAHLLEKSEAVAGSSLVAQIVDIDLAELRPLAEALVSKLKSCCLLLGARAADDKCQIFVRLSDDLVAKGLNASDIVRDVAPLIDGSGGGKSTNAQAGGKNPQNLPAAIAKGKELILESLKA
jgi:alanyl-tRNA synthetase